MTINQKPGGSGPQNSTNDSRGSDGRFMKGHCANPNGRPPKPKLTFDEMLLALMAEQISTVGPGGQQAMPVSEALWRSVINHAFKNPSVALKLFELLKSAKPPSMEGQETAADANEALIAGFLAREVRRRGERPEAGPKEPGSDDDEPGDE